MKSEFLIASLAATPAVALLASWPRRRGAALVVVVGAGGLWLYGAPTASHPLGWGAAGVWAVLSGLFALYVVSRNDEEHRKIDETVEQKRTRREHLTKQVSEARGFAVKAEVEQKEVMALYGMVKGVTEALSWDEVRPKLEIAVQQYLGLEEFTLYVADLRAEKTIHPLVSRYMGASIGANWEVLEKHLNDHRLSLGQTHVLKTPEKAIFTPIRDGQEIMGYFYARVSPPKEPDHLVKKVEGFVDEIAFAFRRVKLFQELERLSKIDGLTGMYRRGVLDERLKEEVIRAKTFKTNFCLMLMDIDHFKRFNDTYGHPFGDQVLKRVGEILRGSVYETDFVARYGGEEFALLMPRADPDGVLRKAQAIRHAVEKEDFNLEGQKVKVTLSIGIAHFPRDADAAEGLIRQADQALYRAKDRGRNRVIDVALNL